MRKVKGHIRCEIVMTKGRYKLIRYVGVGKRFLADRLYDVRWQKGYLERKGIRVRRDGVGREDVEWGEYKECNEIEGLFGNMKLSGYVAVYREDIAMMMALVKFLFCNM